MKEISVFQKLIWLSIFILIVGVISIGIITNITLRSVEDQLPKKLLTELNDLSLVLDSLSDTVMTARDFNNNPKTENIVALLKEVDSIHEDVVRLRESYVIDNLVQASALHAILAPAIADLKIWLAEGVSGLNPTNEMAAKIIFSRINDAYLKARLVNQKSRNTAQLRLIEQQKRLHRFITNVNILLVLTVFIIFGMLFLLIRQYTLQLSESKAQSELLEQRDLLSSLFENVALGITLWGQNGNLLYANKGFNELTGYSKSQIKSLEDWFLYAYPDPNYRKQVISDWNDSSTTNEAIRQFKVVCQSEEEKDIEFRGTFLKDGRALVTLSDMTWRVQAEQEKIYSQKIIEEHKRLSLVGQIAGKMAHDFNNILGIIMGNTELILLNSKDSDTNKIVNLIFEQTVRGKNLTKNLIAFAKDQEPKQEFFNLNEKIDLVINLLRKDLEGIDVIKDYSIKAPDLLADPGMIEHALVNLLKNSIHALSKIEHPKIIIRVSRLNDTLCVDIQDNGCGIPKEHIQHIYEPSFTLKGSNDILGAYANGIKGTGYGMANIKKYVEQHKGTISVKSDLETGTTFTIKLPIVKKELTKQEKLEITQEPFFSSKYILLVEDEKSLAEVQYKLLTGEPFNHIVDIAQNGQSAMDLFNTNDYDFVSLDYILPGKLNGMDIYKYIREKEKLIPILFISGNIEFIESINKIKGKDPHLDHLSKPCTNKDYIKSINKLLGIVSIYDSGQQ